MPSKKTENITLTGIILLLSLVPIIVRVFFAYAPWPIAFIPLAACVISAVIRGYRQS